MGGSSLPCPKLVLKRNKELLYAQKAALAEEYCHSGAWAHELAVLEVGGLVFRMPLKIKI
jgi:hypothetical protein